MEKIWENLSPIKEKVTQYAEIASTNDWIGEDIYNDILERMQNDTLTIAVIGQMKSGKSTFLNAFLFRDTILPALSAALSVITYGEKEEVIADFYSVEEWEEIKQKALLDEEEPDIIAAKELKEKSVGLGEQIDSMLGKSQSVGLSELMDYVGGDGKYTPITKSITIKTPDTRLKGVRIVDTPGFNDPVLSREERTKAFLKEADVVILLLYAGRAFDESDRDILMEKVKNVGAGKIIIGVNKYDIEVANGESVDGIKKYVQTAIKKAVYEKNDAVLNNLLTNPEPILLSANMALMGIMPKEKIMKDADLQWHYEKICKDFVIHSQEDILRKSNIDDLEKEIDNVLAGDKLEIIVRRPINRIQACIDSKKTEYENKTLQLQERKKNLSMPDEDLNDKSRAFSKAKKKITRIIESKGLDIKEFLNEQIKDTIFQLKKIRQDKIDHFHIIIDTQRKPEKIKRAIESEMRTISWTIENEYKDLYRKVKSKFKEVTNDTVNDLEEILSDLSDEEWNDRKNELTDNCRKELMKFDKLSFEDMFTSKNVEKEKKKLTFWDVMGDVGIAILGGAIGLGIKKTIQSILEQKKFIEDAHKQADTLLPMDKIEETFQPIYEKADEFISYFNDIFLNDLLNPIVDNINAMQSTEFDKQKELENIESELLSIEDKKALIKTQLTEVDQYINALSVVGKVDTDEIHLEYNPNEKITVLTCDGKNIELPCIGSGKNIAIETYIPDFFNELQKRFRLGKGAKRRLSFYGKNEDFKMIMKAYHEFSINNEENGPDFKLKLINKEFN